MKLTRMRLAGAVLAFFLTSTESVFGQGGMAVLTNPVGTGTLCGFIKNILNVVLAIGVPIVVLFIVYAGFLFVAARGKPEALAKARSNFAAVLIGTFVFLGAWVLGQVIANTINSVQQGSGAAPTASFASCN